MPCSGPYSAVSETPGALNRMSIVLRPARSRPEWFVSSPTRLPRMRCRESVTRTSTPGMTPAEDVRTWGVAAGVAQADTNGRTRESSRMAEHCARYAARASGNADLHGQRRERGFAGIRQKGTPIYADDADTTQRSCVGARLRALC